MPEGPLLPAGIYARAWRAVIDRTTAEVVSALAENGLSTVLLKGASIARWLYDEDEVRTYVDADLLVDPTKVSAVEQILKQIGFEFSGPPDIPDDRLPHDRQWTRIADRTTVDLHRTLFGAAVSDQKVWDVLSERTQTLSLHDSSVQILDAPARCMQLAFHVVQHPDPHGQAAADLQRGLERVDVETWRQASEVARELDGLAAFSFGLSASPEGRSLLAALDLEESPTVEVMLLRERTPAALGLLHLTQQRSVGAKARLLWRKTFPPARYLGEWWPPARSGGWRLVVGYVWRVLFLLRQSLSAWRSLRKARERASRNPR